MPRGLIARRAVVLSGKLRQSQKTILCKLFKQVTAAVLPWVIIGTSAYGQNQFVPTAADAVQLETAILQERPAIDPPLGVTGISVPHHLLAADLIARGFWAASKGHYDRIILMSPDHFRAVQGRFATTQGDLETPFGTVALDSEAVLELLGQGDLFEPIEDVSSEHGIMAVAPFVRYFFPNASVVPVIAGVNTNQADWEEAASALAALVDDRTLIVQSTDYSHYLPWSTAVHRDQETLGILAADDVDAISSLVQPAHMDSLAAQFVQMAVQRSIGSYPVVIANRNSAEYVPAASSTTSYIVTIYVADPATGSSLRYDDQTVVYFAGDALLGRFLTPILADAPALTSIVDEVLAVTEGAPLIVNLEGVILEEPVFGAPTQAHLMLGEIAIPILTRLGVVAAGLANNHSHDFGDYAFAETLRILHEADIRPLQHGVVTDLGAIRVLPLNFLRGLQTGSDVIAAGELDAVCAMAAEPPLIAVLHWGQEYTSIATDDERDIAQQLHNCGVSVIVGGHSHRASGWVESLAGGSAQMVFSLGNFIYDQNSETSSGALLEMRIFRQGTVVARLVPIPNLFELGTAMRETES